MTRDASPVPSRFFWTAMEELGIVNAEFVHWALKEPMDIADCITGSGAATYCYENCWHRHPLRRSMRSPVCTDADGITDRWSGAQVSVRSLLARYSLSS